MSKKNIKSKKSSENHKDFIRKYFLYALTLFVGIILGSLISSSPTISENLDSRTTSSNDSYKFISPLLECDVFTPSELKKVKKIEKEVEAYINSEKTKKGIQDISILYRELDSGVSFSINPETEYSPASLFKVITMLTYYKSEMINPGILESTVFIEDDFKDILQSDEYIEDQIELGETYSMDDLINRMIAFSDNKANTILRIGLENTFDDISTALVEEDLGFNYDEKEWDIVKVGEYASIFRSLYNATYLDEIYSEKALELLTRTNYKEGLRADIPEGITISHKFGIVTSPNPQIFKFPQVHDCGIVYHPNKTYLLCVMTKGNNIEQLESTISDISNLVYEKAN